MPLVNQCATLFFADNHKNEVVENYHMQNTKPKPSNLKAHSTVNHRFSYFN